MISELLSGLGIGLLFGYAVQRGRFCMNSAFRDIVLFKDLTLFRAYILALLVQMIAVHLLAQWNVITPTIPPFFWLAASLGGFFFGIGMTFAGGCATSSWYRIGEGMVGSFLAILGFALSAAATYHGILRPLLVLLRRPRITVGGEAATMANILGTNEWVIILILSTLGGLWFSRSSKPTRQQGWSWITTGLVVGLITAAAWVASGFVGRSYGLSIAQPTSDLLITLTDSNASGFDWGMFSVLGIPLGSLLASTRSGECRLRAPHASRLLQQFGGGVLMGIGGAISGGCNVSHGLTGLAVLSMNSLVATLSLIGGVWATTYFLFMRE
ncbi:MAG: YeeE/YedE family protein [Candidatus Tectomicrobia bacterium]|nr:YeeE/YedE family protein [Candidatus Tectomicrobia bacterium]